MRITDARRITTDAGRSYARSHFIAGEMAKPLPEEEYRRLLAILRADPRKERQHA